jgi:protein SCO1/2
MRRATFALVLLACAVVAGCGREAKPRSASRYPIRGKVVETDAAGRSVTLAHEEIPGFMPAMTMPFVVLPQDSALIGQMAPGDSLEAALVVADSRYWLEQIVLVKSPVPAPPGTTATRFREPQPGDALPDVALVDQAGRALRLSDFRGRSLAITFVFTRCPMPDFCPFLMRGFARAHEALVAEAGLARRTALLTVSFDVRHDTPPVLLAYGRPFQKTDPPFTHWRLATGSLDAIRELGAAVGLEFGEEEGSFNHNLRTAVFGPDGRLRRILRGNDWKPEELLAELRAADGG